MDAANIHGISGHSAAIRWTAFHSNLDGEFGDGLVFTVSTLEQLDKTLDAFEAGLLPADLAELITGIYDTIKSVEPAYHF
jgi:aflatoxin B1 aldehyde reductase